MNPGPTHALTPSRARGAGFAAAIAAVSLAAGLVGGVGGWLAGPATAREDAATPGRGVGATTPTAGVSTETTTTSSPPPSAAPSGARGEPGAPGPSGPTSSAGSSAAADPSGVTTPSGSNTTASLASALTSVIAAVEASTGAKLGVAALAAGGRGTVVHAGSWTTGHAWSTIKAPIAVAALTAAADSAFDAAARQAITISDNDAAQALWTSLGSADEAAAATEAVLRRGGDSSTTVQRVKTRPEYSVFGQTTWSLADQVVFAAGFPTGDAADQVWDLMGQIDSSQRWGLAEFSGAHFKGGWGPDDAGYVVRQFGQVPVPGGCAALAIGGWAPDFATGTRALTALADGLADLADQLPTGPCR